MTGPWPATAATAAGVPPRLLGECAAAASVFGSLAPSSQMRTVTSGLARYRAISAGPSLRNPVARRSRIFHSRLLTAPESALSASGAVIFHVAPSFSSLTVPRALSTSTRLALS